VNAKVVVFPTMVGLLLKQTDHHRAHHQELFQTAVTASGCRVNAEVVVFPTVVGLLLKQTDHGWKHDHLCIHTATGGCNCSLRAPDDGHDGAQNMLSGVYVTKQLMLRLIGASGWVFYLKPLM
jgi:hypothetical protein